MDMKEAEEKLLAVIQDIAEGRYSNDIMEFTKDGFPEPMRRVAEAMGMMMVKVEAREFHLEQLIEQLRELNERIKQNTIKVVSSLAQALAARDKYTEGHTTRVGELSRELATRLGLSEDEADGVYIGGQLHDIGKIGFSDLLFLDHSKKNSPEMVKEIIRHPDMGADILQDLDFLGSSIDYVRCHHERIDGSGYPRHLDEKDIPLGAQIIGIADGFDAMTTDRPYQKARTYEEALDILRNLGGKKFRSELVEAFARLIEDRSRAEESAKTAEHKK